MTPVDIMGKVVKLASNIQWKHFHIRDIPVAIYDGTTTWLFGHADPGEPFAALDGHPHVFRLFRHKTVASRRKLTD
ncbi:hypothetical protein FE783_04370 [Paenibacillus mesophilus]|uniref:hypothetical protein n=1 Tax=Paenibacillus mesophilus TaxID=2582849 RepID=UPI00110E1D09|nr:hypothetical protein [Paenibacillus mesophilus]TMV52184.1 hypothetical protein FE783_04370 [Paenibacillus mesophilus]